MNSIISLSVLGVLVLFLGILKKKTWLLPFILVGLMTSLVMTVLHWNMNRSLFHNMLIIDNTGVAFSAVMIFSTFLIFMFAAQYYRKVTRPLDDIYAIMIFALIGAVLMSYFGNLIMLFIGIETLSIALYVLAGSHKEAITSNEATLKYFLLGSFLSGFLLFGIALIYGSSGSFDLYAIHTYVVEHIHQGLPPMFKAGLFLLIIGLSFKIAIAPFHFWAPDVYEGTPTLLTAFMASVVKTASVVAMYRFFSITFFGIHGVWEMTVAILAGITIVIGNVTGLYQPNLKRMLAYSSISHSGYMMLAMVAFSGRTANALLFYAVAYSIATIAAFAILILIREARGNDYFGSFNGIAKNNRIEAFTLAVAMLSLTGIPPLAGFIGKYFLFAAAIEQGWLWLVIIAIAGSAISVGYYFKPIIAMYFREDQGTILQAGRPFKISILFLTILTLLLGVLPFLLSGLI
ncbi:MAG: NADH-quinone oxidoreductase subunit N [Bacteroidetes bacterium]|nr:NADH-quinone oxidoreductase subunit N [Bacteroidota bacterium]